MQKGFSMLETLVSIVVLSLGIIGAAAMQLTAFRTTQHATMQTTAMRLASELAEKIRATGFAGTASPDSNPYLGIDYKTRSGPPPASSSQCHGVADCAPAALAEYEIHDLKRRLHAAFPDGRIVVCRDAALGSSARYAWSCASGDAASTPIAIKIGWRDRTDGNASNNNGKEYDPIVVVTAFAPVQ